jgi:glycosyltransferase involved in cell wall biosynthesis
MSHDSEKSLNNNLEASGLSRTTQRLRIGVNSLQIQPGRAISVGIYLRHILDGLARADADNEYLIFVSPGTAGSFASGAPNIQEVVCPGTSFGRPVRILYEQLFLPGLLQRLSIDILFSPENTSPLRLPCCSVLGLQTMMMFTMPQYFPASKREYFKYVMKRAAVKADRIVCVSDNIRREAARYLGVPEQKMVVIPEAPAGFFKPMDHETAKACVVQRYGVDEPYFLAVANMAPYKNLLRQVEAFGQVCQSLNVPHRLLIAGGEAEWPGYRSSVLRAVEDRALKNLVTFLGPVPQPDLAPLYSAATSLVFPSLCESFGLPVVEAMACGCPVITSNYSCLPEVAGGAALLVDPHDTHAIADAMLRVASSAELRRELKDAGLVRAAQLSWDESGRRLAQVFHDVCFAFNPPI